MLRVIFETKGVHILEQYIEQDSQIVIGSPPIEWALISPHLRDHRYPFFKHEAIYLPSEYKDRLLVKGYDSCENSNKPTRQSKHARKLHPTR